MKITKSLAILAFFALIFTVFISTSPRVHATGSTQPNLLKDMNPEDSSAASNYTAMNGATYFTATSGGTMGMGCMDPGCDYGLWKTGGTESGTVLVKSFGNHYIDSGMIAVGNNLYFSAYDDIHGYELWKSNGTEAGTVIVKDILEGSDEDGPYGSNSNNFINVNGTLYFTAYEFTHGKELWKSNGTEAGTVMVKDLIEGANGSYPSSLTNVGGVLYFTADTINGNELWKSNGTEAGTVMVKDIFLGIFGSSYPTFLTNVGGVLYFRANDDTHGYELWKSNGTEAGTVMIKDILEGVAGSSPENLTNVNGVLYFTAYDEVHGLELWKSNGTEAGTVIVKDTRVGPDSTTLYSLTNVNGVLYFNANDGINGYELWKSDGTEAGTVMVKDINNGSDEFGPYSSSPRGLLNIGGMLYFIANNGVVGEELWKSDGTEAGTVLVKDIREGSDPQDGDVPYGSDITNMTNINGVLYFTANDGVHGYEPWVLDTGTGQAVASDSPVFVDIPGLSSVINITEGQLITTNPYTIKVKPTDVDGIQKVEFYIDNVLICTDTTADSDGVYSCDWDTSKYHSDIKVLAYDTNGNVSTALTRSTTVRLANTVTGTLPETGGKNNQGNILWLIGLLGAAYASSRLILKKTNI